MIALLIAIALLTPPPPRMVPIADGLVVIVWTNEDANSVTIDNVDNADCRIVTQADGLFLGTVITQAPEGPPYEGRCALHAGDRLSLLRYRDRQFVGSDGPFVVPYQTWIPVVRR